MEVVTQHALARMQQRGINGQTLDYLIKYGSKRYDNRGCLIVFFDKQSRKRLKESKNSYYQKVSESQMDAYAVVSIAGEVLTVGHRYKRIIRH